MKQLLKVIAMMNINNSYLYSNSINYIKKHNLRKNINHLTKDAIKSDVNNNQNRKEIGIISDKIVNQFDNMKIK